MDATPAITRERFDAVLFDLDGVLTATAKLHAAAWKQMFDEFLRRWAERHGQAFVPFDITDDYHHYVDGKQRFDGVRSFLESRQIDLPVGTPIDSPSADTAGGLGNRKNDLVNEIMRREGVEVFPGSITAVERLRQGGYKTAVVSSSRNCQAVLKAAKIESLFDVRVDGQTAADLQMPGKPAPDMFLSAAQQLNVEPSRAIVVEDAIAGVEAGRRGSFGLVIGIARLGNATALREHGADIVVGDLSELSF